MNFFGLSSKRRRGAAAPFSWTARTSSFSGTQINGIASDGAGTYVAVGNTGKLATSTNAGVTWTQRTSTFGTDAIYDVTYDAGNSLWIAAGLSGYTATAAAADITSWTRRASRTPDTLYGIGSDGSGNSVIVGATKGLSDSTNGTSWTSRAAIFNAIGVGVAFGNSIWVGVGGANNDIITSTDRITWTSRANSLTSAYTREAVYSATEGLWVVVAYNGQIASAPDPTSTWTNRTSGLTASDNIWCVGYGNGYFYAGADDGLSTYSTDGITWTDSTIPAFATGADFIFEIVYDATDDVWVAVGGSGILATSPGS